ncbi:MAG: solute:sodium symporter family transporter [Bacteroidia bacterium]|nr:solute:sodium symporter family transporter [Bacteroidia bacterium]
MFTTLIQTQILQGFNLFDTICFFGFTLFIIFYSLWEGRKEESSEDYFLAGRGLNWWLIGFSLIASNISTEHFVGMAGRGYELGLAIASYEWMAAITLVIVAYFLLPRFLKSGIYTIPEFLEYRYNKTARGLMAGLMMLAYIFVALATVLYSGALALNVLYGLDTLQGILIIAALSGIYTIWGGLKAVVWSDLFQGGALLLGGALVTYLGMDAIGGWEVFVSKASDKLHTVLPADHPEMPWVAVFVGGLWIPNLFYWGLNQFITQRTLAAQNLAEGQKGILFAASMKIIIPFIIVFPGIIASILYKDQIATGDGAYPVLIKNLLPQGLRGFMLAALLGAVMSTLASLVNSASTIFTIDIYKNYLSKNHQANHLVSVGRWSSLIIMIFGCIWAPMISKFENVFQYIQMFWGFISPGIVAVFVWGIFWKKVPARAAITGILLNIPVYGLLLYFLPEVAFLHHMAITFLLISAAIVAITLLSPNDKPYQLPELKAMDLQSNTLVKIWSIALVLVIIGLYVRFF